MNTPIETTAASEYIAPRLERFGTLRDLTLAGPGAPIDAFGQNAGSRACGHREGGCKTS